VFNNTGTINVNFNSTSSDFSLKIYGVYADSSFGSQPELINNGTISIKVKAPADTNATNVQGAGIFLTDVGDVNISNPGAINLESSVSGVNLRTLWIQGTSNVTVVDKFAITFGSPGIEPDMR